MRMCSVSGIYFLLLPVPQTGMQMLAASEAVGHPSRTKALMSSCSEVFHSFKNHGGKKRELISYFICYLLAQGCLATNTRCDVFLR